MRIVHSEEWIRRSRPPALSTNHISISSFFLFPREAVSSMVCDLAPRLATLKATKALHNTILWAMVRAPLLFFDQTPTGRILSRFSSDVEATDNKIPEIISDGIWCFFEVTNHHFEHPECTLLWHDGLANNLNGITLSLCYFAVYITHEWI